MQNILIATLTGDGKDKIIEKGMRLPASITLYLVLNINCFIRLRFVKAFDNIWHKATDRKQSLKQQ